MKTLLIVYHSMTGGTLQMAQAAATGARSEPAVRVSLLRAEDAQASDVLDVTNTLRLAGIGVLFESINPPRLMIEKDHFGALEDSLAVTERTALGSDRPAVHTEPQAIRPTRRFRRAVEADDRSHCLSKQRTHRRCSPRGLLGLGSVERHRAAVYAFGDGDICGRADNQNLDCGEYQRQLDYR